MSLSPPDHGSAGDPASQLVAIGRFALADPDRSLHFEIGLFGVTEAERTQQITLTRAGQRQLLVLTPAQPQRALFPSAWSIFSDFVVLGAEHIVTGLDHLLFLLVVLTAAWGWRQLLLALSVFTLGHAATIALTVWGGLSVPATWVEPAIAATIVGMALFDRQAHRHRTWQAPWLRLVPVFACSLIHGLGLGNSLTALGLDGGHRLTSLAGFNVGIELGQVGVAVVAALLFGIGRRLAAAFGLSSATHLASLASLPALAAIGVGSLWFMQRLAGS